MRDALLVIDAIQDFRHPDGAALLRSFRTRQPGLVRALRLARGRLPVVYVNDDPGDWGGSAEALVQRAVAAGPGGPLVAAVAPAPGDAVLFKGRYSAFDLTPLDLVLRGRSIERVLLCGAAAEMCVAQTAIAARELGYRATVLVDACASADEHDERVALAYLERVAGVRLGRVCEVLGGGGPTD